jgi:hypothetical protein
VANDDTLHVLRLFLLLVFCLGALGAIADLLLIGHVADPWQLVPVILLGLSLVIAGWSAGAGNGVSIWAFRTIAVLLVLSGGVGFWLHHTANIEFAQEVDPALAGFDLFWKAIQGQSPPTLAPGTVIQLGLLALAYTYRHPAVAGSHAAGPTKGEER